MSFNRKSIPDVFPEKDELTRQLVSIGFLFASDQSAKEPNIEDVLLAASMEGLQGDFRTLCLLVDWVSIHLKQINIDRLTSVLRQLDDKRLRAFWSGIAYWQRKDPRMAKLRRIYRGPRIPLQSKNVIQFHLKRDGEDERFQGSSFLVPAKVLRHRITDIATPEWVAKNHLAYRYRIIIGSTYRADMWARLRVNPKASPSELAQLSYGTYQTARQACLDYKIVKRDYSGRRLAAG